MKGSEVFSNVFMDCLVVKRSFMDEGMLGFEALVGSFEEFVLKGFEVGSFGATRLLEKLGVILIDWHTGRSEGPLSVRSKRIAEALMSYLRRRRAECV